MKYNVSKSLHTLTQKLKSYPLSNFDIQKSEPNIVITTSKQLQQKQYADELVNQQGIGVLLWLWGDNEGHWLGLIRNKQNRTFEVFDPYAFPFSQINKKLNSTMGLDPSILTNLIRDSGYKVIFNNRRVQSLEKRDNSCGRFVLLRLALHHYNLGQFHNILRNIRQKHNINPLELSVLYTYEDLNK